MAKSLPAFVPLHEAGHAVVAHAFGMDVVAITAWEHGLCTQSSMPAPSTPSQNDHFLNAAIALAGPIAQHHAGYDVHAGCVGDFEQAEYYIFHYVSADPVRCAAAGFDLEMVLARKLVTSLVEDIVVARFSTIRAIAAAIRKHDKHQLWAADLLALLRHEGGPRALRGYPRKNRRSRR